jgi:hypothetical protein
MVGEIDIRADDDGLGSRGRTNPAGAIGIVDERRLGTGVGDDMGDLAFAIGGVDGHDDDARAKRRDVSDDQVEGGSGAEQHPVSRLQPRCLQSAGDATSRLLQLLGVDPAAIAIEQRRSGRSAPPDPRPSRGETPLRGEIEVVGVRARGQVGVPGEHGHDHATLRLLAPRPCVPGGLCLAATAVGPTGQHERRSRAAFRDERLPQPK